jgi:pyruvate kinase
MVNLVNSHNLLQDLNNLREQVIREGDAIYQNWRSLITRENFQQSAQNLAHYLVLRKQDLRQIQLALMPWGLSSLGKIESRVIPNLEAVTFTLAEILQQPLPLKSRPSLIAFFAGDKLLQKNTEEVFGSDSQKRQVRIMVTLPTEAAENYGLVKELLIRGTDCFRINCAHDRPQDWQKMIEHINRAKLQTQRNCSVLMDLAGPKIRIQSVLSPNGEKRIHPNEIILLSKDDPQQPHPDYWQASCSVPEILPKLKIGTRIWIDDGHLGAIIESINTQGIWLRVTHTRPKGEKLKPDKGINFPQTTINLNPLTPKDLEDLDFVANNADLIGYSFVQTARDIQLLQTELEKRLGEEWTNKAIIAKIETQEAIHNLPELIVQAAGKQPFGVMIARGDLAVEIGYQRLAEMQEEILWLCQAAHVPVIWATQVLETLVKTGIPSRAEITDAAMGERAECVMLNKGPFIIEAVSILDDVLTRMQAHQSKKACQLRALHSWLEDTSSN